MTERGITEMDVEQALTRTTGPPLPGNRPDTIAHVGYASGGRRLKVVVSAADSNVIVTAFWLD